MKKVFAAVIFMALSNIATAGAMLIEVLPHSDGSDRFDRRYAVEITGGQQAGQPGAYYIGAVWNDEAYLYLSPTQGWQQVTGGMIDALEYFPKVPSEPIYYNPITGQRIVKPTIFNDSGAPLRQICDKIGFAEATLYAGIGVLTQDKEDKVNYYHAKNNPRISADHIRKVYILNEMGQNQRGWSVGSFDCSLGEGN